MRVDKVPAVLQLPFQAYGYSFGALWQIYFSILRRTCQFEVVDETATYSSTLPTIDCVWHKHIPAYLVTHLPAKKPQAWLNHPEWYMEPIHKVLRWNGIDELVLGSSGYDGQVALEKLIHLLLTTKTGSSCRFGTMVAVDGPRGPPGILKRGALEIAKATRLPLVGVQFEYENAIRVPTWDGKYFPLPGSKIIIHRSRPIYVKYDDHNNSSTEEKDPTSIKVARKALLESLGS
jgi:lysophospholipid acyltransferase (LPLAT)-like uncharacterized protein